MSSQLAPITWRPDRPRYGEDGLTALTMERVVQTFNSRTKHRPSDEMLGALSAIPTAVSGIVNGTAPAAYHLCALDTGVGKTTTLAETIRQLRRPDMPWGRQDGGTIICVGRYTQIEALVEDMGLRQEEFAVLVGKGPEADKVRARGSA
ncbi:MAG TPA: hypothetical protein VF982_00955, partial [Anaerolineales bacterium]